MKELIIHIGTSKTGTSFIQATLANNANQLIEKEGILYPKSGRPKTSHENKFGHHLLGWELSGKNGCNDRRSWEHFEEECSQSSASRVLISAEGFSALSKGQIEQLNARTTAFNKVGIILYIRNPLSFLIAAYKQQTKSNTSYSAGFNRFVQINAHRCDYEQLVSNWASVFGTERIKLRVYDYEVATSSILASFTEAAEISTSLIAPGSKLNISPSDAIIKCVSILNKLSASSPEGLTHRLKRKLLRSRLNSSKLFDTIVGPLDTTASFQNLSDQLALDDAEFLKKCLSDEELGYLNVKNYQAQL